VPTVRLRSRQGHNLDDEAATPRADTPRSQTEYIARQHPILRAEPGLAKKVKPLYRLSELEEDRAELRGCESCGQRTTGRFCAFCRAAAHVLGRRLGTRPSDAEVAAATAEEVLPEEVYGRAAG